MSPSLPTYGAPEPSTRVLGSSSPTGLTSESDEDLWSDSGESEVADPSDGADGNGDGYFIPNQTMSRSRTRSRRTSSVSMSSGSVRAPRPCRLSAPVPVPNLTKKSRARRVPTAPVFIVQGGVQKNMRMYRCTVDGCYKCFARGEHLKRHVRSIHTNEKREYLVPFGFVVAILTLLQRTSVLSRDVGRISVGTTTSGSTCAYIRVKPSLTTTEPIILSTLHFTTFCFTSIHAPVYSFPFVLTFFRPTTSSLRWSPVRTIFTFSCLSFTMVRTCQRSLLSRAMNAESVKHCRRMRAQATGANAGCATGKRSARELQSHIHSMTPRFPMYSNALQKEDRPCVAENLITFS